MRIVISGATSMIGAALTNKLLENNHEIIAVVRPNSKKIVVLKKVQIFLLLNAIWKIILN